jgi:hypothetical protein
MYGKGFTQGLIALESGQPHWLASGIQFATHVYQSHSALFNTLAALVQVAIGLGDCRVSRMVPGCVVVR